MRITLGPSVVRGNIDETITGLWRFANALGLLTDDIGERTAAHGVEVDGLLIKDAGIPEAAVTAHEAALAILESQIVDGTILARLATLETVTARWIFDAGLEGKDTIVAGGLPAAGSDAFASNVTGDAVQRWTVDADGRLEWGDGTAARDTNLFRAGANILETEDTLRVGSNLEVLGPLILGERAMTLSGGATDHNVATGSVVVQRMNPNGTTAIGGFAGGEVGRAILVFNTTGSALTITHQNSGSLNANRIICPNASNFNITGSDGCLFWYDNGQLKWRTLALNP